MGKEAAIMYIDNSDLIVDSTDFHDNTSNKTKDDASEANVGANMIFQNGAEVEIRHSNFDGNHAKQGAGIYATERTIIDITNCTFTNNEVGSQAAGVIFESSTVATVSDCLFEHLHSNETASAMTVNEATATINNTVFKENTSNVGLAQVATATVLIIDSSFRDNFATEVTNGFSVTESDFRIQNSFITNKGGPPSRRRNRRLRRR